MTTIAVTTENPELSAEQKPLDQAVAELAAAGAYPEETPPTPDPGLEAANAEIAARERPEWLPEGFDTPEALAEAYKALKEAEAPKAEVPDGEEAPDGDEPKPGKISAEMLEAEFEEHGKITDETLAKLEEAGLDRQMVEGYLAGIQAQVELYTVRVEMVAGGSDQYRELIDWAGKNLTEAEIDQFDDAVGSADLDKAKFAVEALVARRAAKFGQAPSNVVSGEQPTGATAYESEAQMLADMSNPLYHSDPAFRAKVAARVAAGMGR